MACSLQALRRPRASQRHRRGCGANVGGRANQESGRQPRSSSENRVPNLGRGFVFDAKLAEFELTLPDPMHQFDAGDRRRGSSKMLEAEHRAKPQLDGSVALFNQIVEVFGRPDLALISLRMFSKNLSGRAM
jgi:hypothetical protein